MPTLQLGSDILQFRQHTLANGLEIVAECIPTAYSTALGFFVKTGARDESDELSGVSHFLEHMVFKGTPTRSAEDVNRELDELGSHSNAYTSEEQTVYYATVLPEFQDRAVDLLSDIMRPSLREDDFNTEKLVILEEIAKYEDQPPYNAHEKCMAAHFGKHPLARSVLGTVQSVGALTAEQMRSYFQQRYSPSNITLVGSGKIDFERLVAVADRHCGAWEKFEAPREAPRAAANHSFELIHKESATQQYSVELCNGPSAEDEDRYAGRLLATILGDETGSRLFWELVDPGLAEYAAVASYEYQGTGVFMTFLCCAPEDTAENMQIAKAVFREARKKGVTEEELLRAKSKICSNIILSSERPSNRIFGVGTNWIQRREYRTVREAVEMYQRVTVKDIAAVLKKYPLEKGTAITIGPLTKM